MRIRAKKSTGSGGFSLVELLIAVALISILLAIGVPTLVGQIYHLRLSRSVRDVAVELNAARLKAIAQNKKYQVDFTVNSGTTPDTFRLKVCNSGACPSASDWTEDPSRPLGEFGSGIDMSSPSANFTVDFYPNGAASAQTMCIANTTKDDDRMKITVGGTTGMITVDTGC